MKIISSFLPPERIRNETVAAFPDLQFEFYKDMKKAEASLMDAEILITYGEDVTAEHVKNAPYLKWIMIMSAGMERMPFRACLERDILVTNARGIHKIPMAEFALGLMLQYVKQANILWENASKAIWDRRLPMAELFGKAVLILGVGAIGGEIARLSKAFQMKVYGINTTGKSVPYVDATYKLGELNEALPKADFIINILPSTAKTKHLLQDHHFKRMKNSAVFINIGRGDIVEEEILLHALTVKEITFAYLDVFPEEPLPTEHPYWQLENVMVTPHISSLTKNYLTRSFEIFYENLQRYRDHSKEFVNQIDLERGY